MILEYGHLALVPVGVALPIKNVLVLEGKMCHLDVILCSRDLTFTC